MCFSAKSNTDMEIEILEDGTVKVTTGSISAGSAHVQADELLAFLASELGGEQTQKARAKSARTHTHAKRRLTSRG